MKSMVMVKKRNLGNLPSKEEVGRKTTKKKKNLADFRKDSDVNLKLEK